jgi:hypothetical protein
MCIMAILYRSARNAPVLVAANREELFDRPTQHPRIQSGTPRVICGIDRQAGGTWLGVNQHGLVCAVANRRKSLVPAEPRSRGLLCRELLNCRTAREASEYAARELAIGKYAGANYLCVDARFGAVVHGGDRIEIAELTPGLHIVSHGDLDDPNDERHEMLHRMLTLHKLDSAVTFLAVASRAFARRPDAYGRPGMVLTGGEFGTVSSTLLSLPRRIQQAVMQYAPGPPSEVLYEDLSALLRQVLSAERSRAQEKAAAAAARKGNHSPAAAAKPAASKSAAKTASKPAAKPGAKSAAKPAASRAALSKAAGRNTDGRKGSAKAKKKAKK